MTDITPRVDIAFKKIFGVEENKDLLISLINSIVSVEDQVADVRLLNPYNAKNFKNDKLSILDIKAKGENGKRYNIEIQITDEADYDKRALYYWAKLYTEQLKGTQDYSNLEKAIGIHILNFISIPESIKYHNSFHITEKESGIKYFQDLELHTVELRKFTDETKDKELNEIMTKVKTSLDAWVMFLTKHNLLDKDNLPNELENTGVKKALNILETMNFSEYEREEYEDHLKWLRIQTNTLRHIEQKGIEKGLAQGREEGSLEKANNIATNMLKENLDIELIKKITGLTHNQLLKLKDKFI